MSSAPSGDMLHAHINAPWTASVIQTVLLRMISIFPGSCPGFLVDFFSFYFRIADTACVCSYLSGLKYCYAGDVTQMFEKCVSLTVLSPSLQRYTDISIPNWQNFSFLLIYFWVCISIKYCLNLTVSYIYVKSEKNSHMNMIWDASVHFETCHCQNGVLTAY